MGGLISMNFDSVTSSSALSLSFTESPMFVRPVASDDSSFPSANTTFDGVLHISTPLSTGFWTQPAYTLRGGFRFLTIVSNSPAPVTISNVSCSISFMPHVDDLRQYTGYFSAANPTFHDPNFLTKSPSPLYFAQQTYTNAISTSMVRRRIHSPNQYSGC